MISMALISWFIKPKNQVSQFKTQIFQSKQPFSQLERSLDEQERTTTIITVTEFQK